jgi:hypothetical protein
MVMEKSSVNARIHTYKMYDVGKPESIWSLRQWFYIGERLTRCGAICGKKGFIACPKEPKILAFRGMFYAEESLILLTLNPGEIPRFARNDTKRCFFRSL